MHEQHGRDKDPYLFRPARSFSFLVLFTLLLLLAACGDNNTSVPDAHQLISKAQAAIKAVTAYHFKLTTDHSGTGATLTILKAEGDIAVPDKLKANATALILGGIAQVQIIVIGDQQYISDPITQQWHTTTGLIDPRTLSDPQMGVAAILGHIQNPSTASDTSVSVDGTPCWNVNGKLDPTYLSGITLGSAPPGTLDSVTTCIGKSNNLPYLIRIMGIAATGDTAATTRTFTLSMFGESISIMPPPVGTPTP
jgi:hypothetical protein